MKAFITLAVVCLVASALANPLELSEEQKAKAKVYIEECAKQENVPEEDVMKFRNKDVENPSKAFKCLGTCFFERAGTLKNDELQDDVVIAKLGALVGEEKAKTVLEKCKGIKAEDRCETGYKTFQCFHSFKAAF
ncbi:general odorant-binding protein 56a-like [Musca vetustissima]|uniref:general odorant-binding protein 56a-like n=1 Tax=Musca vetustissima TaxID=27455 RepID=UPI002AB67097|nr:general odorant-binding protein 56a-like [Musca vetustissima]